MDGKKPVEVVKATEGRVRKTALAILDRSDTALIGGKRTPPDPERDTAHREAIAVHARPAAEPAFAAAGGVVA